jgi:hypothetical protein
MAGVSNPVPRRSSDNQAEVQVISISLPADVRAMLEAADPDVRVLILPPYQRDGRSFYGPDDVDAVRLARGAGLNAAFLHKAEDRQYLHEYSAGWAVNFAIAFAAHLAAEDVAGMLNYVIARARKAVHEGLHAGPVEKVPLMITVGNYHRETDGAMTLKGLEIEGPAAAAVEALRALVETDTRADGPPQPVSDNTPRDTLKSPSKKAINSRKGPK